MPEKPESGLTARERALIEAARQAVAGRNRSRPVASTSEPALQPRGPAGTAATTAEHRFTTTGKSLESRITQIIQTERKTLLHNRKRQQLWLVYIPVGLLLALTTITALFTFKGLFT